MPSLQQSPGNITMSSFPRATWEGRQWSVSNFAEVAERMHHRTGWQGVVCGGRSEVELADTLCARSTAPLLNWAGRTDLPQLASILSASRLVLTNETSAVHIAAACGTPTVCLLGGGHFGRFMPYKVQQSKHRPLPRAVIHSMPCFGCNWECIYERQPGRPSPLHRPNQRNRTVAGGLRHTRVPPRTKSRQDTFPSVAKPRGPRRYDQPVATIF